MSKPREAKNIEFYLGQIRTLQKEVKQLNRIIKSLKKQQHLYDDIKLDNEIAEEIVMPPKHRKCEACGKGDIIEFELIGRMFEKCSICDHRKKLNG